MSKKDKRDLMNPHFNKRKHSFTQRYKGKSRPIQHKGYKRDKKEWRVA